MKKDVNAHLNISPEIIRNLSSGKRELWSAARPDGSDNRINGETVAEAATYSFIIASLVAGFQWIRKKFRNRGKTAEDFSAEKEAVKINKASDALEALLLEYIQSAQEGSADPETLDELTGTLAEVEGYARTGTLKVTGKAELAEIRKSITDFTAALGDGHSPQLPENPEEADAGEFHLIRDQIAEQRRIISR